MFKILTLYILFCFTITVMVGLNISENYACEVSCSSIITEEFVVVAYSHVQCISHQWNVLYVLLKRKQITELNNYFIW